jgi:hypothetical protein
MPSWDDFKAYGEEKLRELSKPLNSYEYALKAKYESWVDNGWVDGNGKKIVNWKLKLTATIPYLKEVKPQQPTNYISGVL